MITAYQRDGAVLIKGLWANWVDTLRAGIDRNLANPSEYAAENLKPGEGGRFFDDYCNWTRIPEFETVIRQSDAADVAAKLMRSNRVQLFHDHVLVKEPGTSKSTPWHQDQPYYFVEGRQNVSFWSPLNPVNEASLRCVAGSRRSARRSGQRRLALGQSAACRRRPGCPDGRWSRRSGRRQNRGWHEGAFLR